MKRYFIDKYKIIEQIDFDTIFKKLLLCWSKETCTARLRDKWSKDDPSVGQCSITAFLIQDIYGGDVFAIFTESGDRHCFNYINGCVIDLTYEQFHNKKLLYELKNKQSREEHFKDKTKYNRYLILKNNYYSH